MTRTPVPAKINLALLVGETRPDGMHEIATVYQRVDLCDGIDIEVGESLAVHGFPDDTLVDSALRALAAEAGIEPPWTVRVEKHIPVAAGLGGGSADAAAALRLANHTLANPLGESTLRTLAVDLGADIPFFLSQGPQLGEGIGDQLTPLELPQDYWVVIALPRRSAKLSTGSVYRRFDELGGSSDFASRRTSLRAAVERCTRARELGALPGNDLAEASGRPQILDELSRQGAFKADVSGAGPAVFGLFLHKRSAQKAAWRLRPRARVWLAAPVW